jgi:hypothetical protein
VKRLSLAAAALLSAGCAAQAPAPEVAPSAVASIAGTPVPEAAPPRAPAPAPAPARAADPTDPVDPDEAVTLLPFCYGLALRFEIAPRSAELDAAARAFDRATLDYNHGRYLAAARGFETAAGHFRAASLADLHDRRWSYENAVLALVRARRPHAARLLLLAAAEGNPDMADELQYLADDLPPECEP